MIKIIIYLFSIVLFLYSDINQIIVNIKSVDKKKLFLNYPNYNPFIIKETNKTVKMRDVILVLNAIFNNSANINGKWVRKGDFIYDFRVLKIEKDRVLLVKGKNIFWLSYSKSKVFK